MYRVAYQLVIAVSCSLLDRPEATRALVPRAEATKRPPPCKCPTQRWRRQVSQMMAQMGRRGHPFDGLAILQGTKVFPLPSNHWQDRRRVLSSLKD